MTCDHMEPSKEAKYPDPLGLPLDYMNSHRVFKIDKMSKYDLCHFYQVGLSQDFPKFPAPHKPATNDHLCYFLENARECPQPNLLVVHLWDAVTAVCLLIELHTNASLDALRWRLMPRPVTSQRENFHFAPFANTRASMTCPSSTILSACITMQVMGAESE